MPALLRFTLDTSPEPDTFALRAFHVLVDEIIAVAEGELPKPDANPDPQHGAILFLRGGGMVTVLEPHREVLALWRTARGGSMPVRGCE